MSPFELTLSQNTAPDGKRAASIGITLAVGNLGGIISGQICELLALYYVVWFH